MGKKQPEYCRKNGLHVFYINGNSVLFGLMRVMRLLSHDRYMLRTKEWLRKKLEKKAKHLHSKFRFGCVLGHSVYVGDESVPLGKVLGVPSILVLHGVYGYEQQIFGKRAMERAIASANGADGIVAVSKTALDSYNENGLRNPNVHIIPNGVKNIEPDGDHKFKEFVRGKTALLSVGFFTKEKRIDQAIRALKHLLDSGETDSVLIIVGKGAQERYLKRFVRNLGLGQNVLFAGEIDPAEMGEVYRAIDILVHPSIVESFSMVCLEAMSFGKPVVCTSNIGLVEYIRPGVDAIVVPPDNQQKLSDAVFELVKSSEYRKKIGEAARKTAEKMGWEIQAEKMIRVIEGVV